ncbi:electron transport complex subunit RsxB [Advenella sp. RU8]|uniref:electron transport complex subunit RsxB n=1 Tax=Advenella sp. RU8 TaxID=3399575 RepID=UPI003AAF1619
MTSKSLLQKIDAILPQTQCTKCGYDGCKPYAQALVQQEANINRCPPGGTQGIQQLADLLQVPVLPLDPECGTETPLQVAVIDEAHCIGCTLCIRACPVDAIIGANKFMHTVDPQLCTGCDLCVAPCPVDCISMVNANRSWTIEDANAARDRHERRAERLHRQSLQEEARLNQHSIQTATHSEALASLPEPVQAPTNEKTAEQLKKEAIALALQRARERRLQSVKKA